MFSSCNPKLFAVRHIHYPVNPSSGNCHTDTVVPSSDHCRTEAVLPPSDHYCIETVAPCGDHYCIDIVVPSGDHYCIEIVLPSSDHYGTTKVAPFSDHLHRPERNRATSCYNINILSINAKQSIGSPSRSCHIGGPTFSLYICSHNLLYGPI